MTVNNSHSLYFPMSGNRQSCLSREKSLLITSYPGIQGRSEQCFILRTKALGGASGSKISIVSSALFISIR